MHNYEISKGLLCCFFPGFTCIYYIFDIIWMLCYFQTLSYNGYLTFTVEHGSIGTELSDLEGLRTKPLVVLSGYGIPLMYK